MILLDLWTIGTGILLQYPESVAGNEQGTFQTIAFSNLQSNHLRTCPGQCAMDLMSNLKRRIGDSEARNLLDLNYNNFLFAMSNATVLQQFCHEIHLFEYCCSSCTPSYLQEVLMGCSQIIDHICIYNFKDIKENFGCLAQLDPQMKQPCMRTCTPNQEAFHSIARNFRHFVLNGDATILENYLNESCEYVVCSLHCDIPLIVHNCGFNIAEKVIALTRNSFATMKKVSLNTGAIVRWPQACAEIITYRLPKRGLTDKHRIDQSTALLMFWEGKDKPGSSLGDSICRISRCIFVTWRAHTPLSETGVPAVAVAVLLLFFNCF